jgi:hypothetical protein
MASVFLGLIVSQLQCVLSLVICPHLGLVLTRRYVPDTVVWTQIEPNCLLPLWDHQQAVSSQPLTTTTFVPVMLNCFKFAFLMPNHIQMYEFSSANAQLRSPGIVVFVTAGMQDDERLMSCEAKWIRPNVPFNHAAMLRYRTHSCL